MRYLCAGRPAAVYEGTTHIGSNTGEDGVAKGGWMDKGDSPLSCICMYMESSRPPSIKTSPELEDEDVTDGSGTNIYEPSDSISCRSE